MVPQNSRTRLWIWLPRSIESFAAKHSYLIVQKLRVETSPHERRQEAVSLRRMVRPHRQGWLHPPQLDEAILVGAAEPCGGAKLLLAFVHAGSFLPSVSAQ